MGTRANAVTQSPRGVGSRFLTLATGAGVSVQDALPGHLGRRPAADHIQEHAHLGTQIQCDSVSHR